MSGGVVIEYALMCCYPDGTTLVFGHFAQKRANVLRCARDTDFLIEGQQIR